MDNSIIEKVSAICARHFNIDEREIYSKIREEDRITARHLLWYVLHVDFKVSTGVLSKEFFRTRRQIFSAIGKIRLRLKVQRFYREIYSSFMNELEKEGIHV